MTHPPDLTVVITSFKRAGYLRRCIDSCIAAGLTRIACYSMCPDDEIMAMLSAYGSRADIDFKFDSTSFDFGCHNLWERAAYLATTKYVIVLHDDDCLDPKLGDVYRELIHPALERSAGFASWRAHIMKDDGRMVPTEYMGGPTRITSSNELEQFLLRRGRLSLSPIVSVFNRDVLIQALKECDKSLTDSTSYLHPGMQLGTEVLVYLRHCSAFRQWLFVSQVLSYYGSHGGSGTVHAEQTGTIPKLAAGYDFARQYFEEHRNNLPVPEPRIILLHSPYTPQSEEERVRVGNAQLTWRYHNDLGHMQFFPVYTHMLPRSAQDLGDPIPAPYLRDMMDIGAQHASTGDIIAYSNMDLAFTVNAHEEIKRGVKAGNGVCVAWRRTMPVEKGRLLSTCKNGKIDGGVDIFACALDWWNCHRQFIPDSILLAQHWDFMTRCYAERVSNHTCYISEGFYHAPHESMKSRTGMSPPRQRHNLALAKNYFKSIGDQRAVKMLMAEERQLA